MKTLAETRDKMEVDFYQQAREELICKLALLTPDNHRIFRYMYAGKDRKAPTDEEMKKPIADIVRDMPDEKLDWAVQQVQRSVDNLQ